jgi:hypothetical protein
MTIALLEKKTEDLSDVVFTLEQRIDEEHVCRKSLQQDLNALNHFVGTNNIGVPTFNDNKN